VPPLCPHFPDNLKTAIWEIASLSAIINAQESPKPLEQSALSGRLFTLSGGDRIGLIAEWLG